MLRLTARFYNTLYLKPTRFKRIINACLRNKCVLFSLDISLQTKIFKGVIKQNCKYVQNLISLHVHCCSVLKIIKNRNKI